MTPSADPIKQLADVLGKRTLAELRDEAARQPNGTRIETYRFNGGTKAIRFFCLTDMDQIELVARVFDLSPVVPPEDWTALTLLEAAGRALCGSGFRYEGLRDEYNRLANLVLITAEERSQMILSRLFGSG